MPVILAVSVCSAPLPSTYFNVTEPSFATAYVPGLMCFSVSFNCFTLTASVPAVPVATLVILLPSTLKLPPEIVVPPPLFNVILEVPFWMLSISLRVELNPYVYCWVLVPNVCSTVRFLPALKVTVSPGTTLVAVAAPVNVPPFADALAFQPALLIACTTLSVVATPFGEGATALPLLLVISSPFAIFTVIPLASAVVEIKPSPLRFNVPSFNKKSPLPVLPAYFKFTLFN